jgi:hypothetical protein
MAYLVDANVFIAAKNLHYGLDFCPAFWDWLAREHAAGMVFSVEKVVDELRAGGDELAEWVARMPDAFSLKPDASTAGSLATIQRRGQKHFSADCRLLPLCRRRWQAVTASLPTRFRRIPCTGSRSPTCALDSTCTT